MSLRGIGVAMALAVVAPSSAPAAGGGQEHQQQAVRFADLDLGSPAGAARMLRRIEKAALEVCGAVPQSLTPLKQAIRRSPCFADAVANAVGRLRAPVVSLIHEGQTRRSPPRAGDMER